MMAKECLEKGKEAREKERIERNGKVLAMLEENIKEAQQKLTTEMEKHEAGEWLCYGGRN